MCYNLYLSTSSNEDLTRFNSGIGFEPLVQVDGVYADILRNSHRWFVSGQTGCSRAFRHLASGELVFDEPQDWFSEEADDIEATATLYRVIDTLLNAGHEVDCLDSWCGASLDEIRMIDVDLRLVAERAFRLFENHHFVFRRAD